MCAVTVRPAVSAFGFRVSRQIKNLNLALPDRLAAKDFMDRHTFAPSRISFMQMQNGTL